ncbi:MAG: carbohydrate ABC transporter permease, partial [Candidatus Omnitrophica bacterium]|nr:carbohydrate ABC transporter permease [Candidatus Omnitrophota bacterium]
MPKNIGGRKDPVIVMFFVYVFLIVGALTMAIPYVWMLVSSIKPLSEIQAFPPSFVVHHPTFAPYRELFKMVPMMRYVFNSIFVASCITIFNVFATSLAGYAFAKHRFFGRDKIFFIFVASLMIPWQVNIIPG